MQKLDAVVQEVLSLITPTLQDREKINALAKALMQRAIDTCEAYGVKANVRIEGSVAKDTWLREEPEIDIFLRLPTSMPRSELGEVGLKIARKATEGAKQVERFAEHPYLEAYIDDVRINIVPCYDVRIGEWRSATDRTPFHTDYVRKHLPESWRSEVRLLKKFFKGVGVYGAEIKTGGFSGYLCELLILHYGSFIEALRAFAAYRHHLQIDIEGYYKDREKELHRLFTEPLVVVDPVDKGRNVASAVQPQRLFMLVAAARAFLKAPCREFFYPPENSALPVEALKGSLENRGSALIFITIEGIEAVPDVLWGQLYRTQRALCKLLELNDFRVIRQACWSDEKTLSVLVFELEQRFLSGAKKHVGPPLERIKECDNFLAKYAYASNVVSGPYVEGDRWVVLLQRKFIDAVGLLKEKLKDGGRRIGVAERIACLFREKLEILVNNEVIDVYQRSSNFAKFLTAFLSGKPSWLETAEAKREYHDTEKPAVKSEEIKFSANNNPPKTTQR
ncbi:MAG: CCA tRNA nucleotidyltransferase [Candidatus Bathyarchaeota archaeon]|nr:CCA tRNA nucleotidyltransferase [Candidatus Bathyarchaeota archaeon]